MLAFICRFWKLCKMCLKWQNKINTRALTAFFHLLSMLSCQTISVFYSLLPQIKFCVAFGLRANSFLKYISAFW